MGCAKNLFICQVINLKSFIYILLLFLRGNREELSLY